MSIESFFSGTLGKITLIGIIIVLVVFIIASIFLIAESIIIIKKCKEARLRKEDNHNPPTRIERLIYGYIRESTDYSSDIVNINTVSSKYNLNLRFMQSMPGILTSLGILGTFVGLAFAVFLFDASTSEGIRASIQTLLSGMSTAFVTSIAGMGCSIFFLGIERGCIHHIHGAIDDLCCKLDAVYHKPMGNEFNEAFVNHFVPAINQLTQKLENPAQVVVESLIKEFKEITENFTDLLTENVNRQMSELLGRFIQATEAIQKIPYEIDMSVKAMQTSSQQTIEAHKEFSESLEGRVSTVTDEILQIARQQSKAIQESYTALNNSLGAIPAHIESAGAQLTRSMEESVSSQRMVTNDFAEQVSNLQSVMQLCQESIASITSVNQDLENIKTSMADITSEVNSSSESMQECSGKIVETFNSMNESLAKTSELHNKFESIQSGLNSIFKEINIGINKYAETSRSGLQTMLNTFTDSVTTATQSISNATNILQETISGSVESINKMESFVKELGKTVDFVRANRNDIKK